MHENGTKVLDVVLSVYTREYMQWYAYFLTALHISFIGKNLSIVC